jgi:transposase-like protein
VSWTSAALHVRSVSPLERLNEEVKRRADDAGICLSEQAIVRSVGAVLLDRTTKGKSSAAT